MKPLLLICALLAAQSGGCGRNRETPEAGGPPPADATRPGQAQTKTLPVESVELPDTIRAGRAFTLRATATAPTPCWKFEKFVTTKQGQDFHLAFEASYDGSPCIQVISQISGASTSTLEPGTYRLRFWRSDSTTLDRTIIVR